MVKLLLLIFMMTLGALWENISSGEIEKLVAYLSYSWDTEIGHFRICVHCEICDLCSFGIP